MSQFISSLSNEKVKSLVKLRNRRDRDETGLTIVEGVKECLMALQSEVCIKEVYIDTEKFDGQENKQDIEALVKLQNLTVYTVSAEVFEKISYGDRAEGILAVCQIDFKLMDSLEIAKDGFVLVLESIEKPGNLGAIMRSADAVGIDAVILSESKTDIYNPNVIRASLGAVFTVPVLSATNEETLLFLKNKKFNIYASTVQSETPYTSVDYRGPTALVLGSEHEGLSEYWVKNATSQIKIPMKGKVDSLNVSTSTAIIIYEAFRQRHK